MADGLTRLWHATGTNGTAQGDMDFYIPPQWAIAHHLIKLWVEHPSPWFSRL